MFAPTEVENYPDGPNPSRGAVFEDALPWRARSGARRERPGEKCVACFLCAAALPRRIAFTSKLLRTPRSIASPRRSEFAKVYNIDYNPLRCIFCRLLRGGLPHRRHYPRPRLRTCHAQRHQSRHAQGRHARTGGSAYGKVKSSFCPSFQSLLFARLERPELTLFDSPFRQSKGVTSLVNPSNLHFSQVPEHNSR